jgi:hypothetical protein
VTPVVVVGEVVVSDRSLWTNTPRGTSGASSGGARRAQGGEAAASAREKHEAPRQRPAGAGRASGPDRAVLAARTGIDARRLRCGRGRRRRGSEDRRRCRPATVAPDPRVDGEVSGSGTEIPDRLAVPVPAADGCFVRLDPSRGWMLPPQIPLGIPVVVDIRRCRWRDDTFAPTKGQVKRSFCFPRVFHRPGPKSPGNRRSCTADPQAIHRPRPWPPIRTRRHGPRAPHAAPPVDRS